MKKQALQVMAQEISRRLKLEMVAGPTVEPALPATIVDLLLEHLTEAVAEHLTIERYRVGPSCQCVEDGALGPQM